MRAPSPNRRAVREAPLALRFFLWCRLFFLKHRSLPSCLAFFFLRYLYHIAVYFKNIYVFILAAAGLRCSLREVLATACGEWCPDQGLNCGLLHRESGVLATGPPGKSRFWLFHIALPLSVCLPRTPFHIALPLSVCLPRTPLFLSF